MKRAIYNRNTLRNVNNFPFRNIFSTLNRVPFLWFPLLYFKPNRVTTLNTESISQHTVQKWNTIKHLPKNVFENSTLRIKLLLLLSLLIFPLSDTPHTFIFFFLTKLKRGDNTQWRGKKMLSTKFLKLPFTYSADRIRNLLP